MVIIFKYKSYSNSSQSQQQIIGWNEEIKTYGELCHILQESPSILARLTHSICNENESLWAETIICDLFGNINNSRNEHLLLRVFENILTQYSADFGEENINLYLCENDNIINKMIESFMNDRSIKNKQILKMILERPMMKLIGMKMKRN